MNLNNESIQTMLKCILIEIENTKNILIQQAINNRHQLEILEIKISEKIMRLIHEEFYKLKENNILEYQKLKDLILLQNNILKDKIERHMIELQNLILKTRKL
jgi:hypothetical protein